MVRGDQTIALRGLDPEPNPGETPYSTATFATRIGMPTDHLGLCVDKREQIRILKELLRQLDEKVNVDAGVQLRNPIQAYTDPALANQEWEHFFEGHPQFIGLSGDLPAPGSFLRVDDFGVPVLATRDPEGRFRAFVNACRHRGTRLVSDPRGESAHFVCPFHNWSYANTGALVGVSRERDFGAVERADLGLIELPAEERYGQLWVHPKPEGKLDVGALLGALGSEFESWNTGAQRYLGETLLEKRLNWKLANDTFGETYHFSRLHKDTLGKIFYGDALDYRVFGRNHRFVFPSRAIDSLRGKPETEWDVENTTTVLYYLFPNIQFAVKRNSATLVRIYPKPGDPSSSVTRVSHYGSEAAIKASRDASKTRISADNVYDPGARDGNAVFSLEASIEVFDSTVEHEDYRMGESTQRAADSGAMEYLLFGRNEPALHHYHNTFRDALGMPPLERVED